MKRQPAPVSTAVAASAIWSGVGEVNTWPGQAASSMPTPTKPACSGSWPEPPPEISATLPGLGARRRTNLRSGPRTRMSAWEAAKPSRLSARKASSAFISFFMTEPPCARRSLDVVDEFPQPADEVGHHGVDAAVALGVAEVGHGERDDAGPADRLDEGQAPRMGAPVGGEKVLPVGLREMAKLEQRLQMLHRDRHGIGGIGDLRDEGTVLAQRPGQALARSRRPVVEHALEDGLVLDHRILLRRSDRPVAHRPRSTRPRSTRAIAALVAASAAGATDSERRPVDNSASTAAGSPPASPHRLTSRPLARPCSAARRMSRSTAGLSGSARSLTAAMSRPAAVTYCVRSFEPIEKNAASKRSIVSAAAGTSTMMPSGGRAAGNPAAFSAATSASSRARAASSSSGTVTMGSMIFTLPWQAARASARS